MSEPPSAAGRVDHTVGAVLIDEGTIGRRVGELARAVRDDVTPDVTLHLVAVLRGAFMFLADFMRAFEGPVTCDFMALSSYGAGTSTSGEVQVRMDVDTRLEGKDVVIVEDIVDSGLTLSYLQALLRTRGPRSLRTVCLLSKPSRRRVAVPVEYVGFEIEDRFVVGYGLDYNGLYRNLPHIAVLRLAE